MGSTMNVGDAASREEAVEDSSPRKLEGIGQNLRQVPKCQYAQKGKYE